MKKLATILLAITAVLCFGIFAACETVEPTVKNPEVPTESTYDIGNGGDFTFQVNLNGGTITKLENGANVIDPMEYLFKADDNTITVFSTYMLYLELGDYTFKLTTDLGSATFAVKVVNTIVTEVETSDKNYVYGSGTDVSINATLSGATVTEFKAGGRKLTANDYSYDAENGKLVINADYCDTLYGTTEMTLTLSNNDVYKFNVISNAIFVANYDDGFIPGSYNEFRNTTTTVDGWDGKALQWKGNGGNFMLLSPYGSNLGFGMEVGYEEGKIYCLSFEFKNAWAIEDSNPTGTIGWSAPESSLSINYLKDTFNGCVVEKGDNGVYSVKVYFKGPKVGVHTQMWTGYDGNNPEAVLFDLQFDNITILEVANDQTPVIDAKEAYQYYSKGSGANLWFDGEFFAETVSEIKVNDTAIEAANYQLYASSVIIKSAYLETLETETEFTVVFESGKTVTFTVNPALAAPSVFDDDNNVEYVYDSDDIIFNVDFKGFPVKSLLNGEKIVPADAYEVSGKMFIVKKAYLDTIAGVNNFTLTLDNAGKVEGKTEDETHAFTITSTAVSVYNFEDTEYNYGELNGICDNKTIVDGFDGKAMNFAGTGGNFLVQRVEGATWAHAGAIISLVEGTDYTYSFDIKMLEQELVATSSDAQVVFCLHTPAWSSNFWFRKDLDGELKIYNDESPLGMILTDKGNGVYNITVRFTYTGATTGNGMHSGAIRLEAGNYQQWNYSIVIDNVALYETQFVTEMVYGTGSNADVAYNVDYTAATSVKVGETVLTDADYAIENGKFIVKGEYAETVKGVAVFTVTLEDGTSFNYTLYSSQVVFFDFEGEYDKNIHAKGISSFLKYDDVVENGIDGKSWQRTSTGGNFMIFAPDGTTWGYDRVVTPLAEGKKYVVSFDIKCLGQYKFTDDQANTEAPEAPATFVLYAGTKTVNFKFDLDTNEPLINVGAEGFTITANANGSYTVSCEFLFSLESGNTRVGMEVSNWKGISYDILIDNVSINMVV